MLRGALVNTFQDGSGDGDTGLGNNTGMQGVLNLRRGRVGRRGGGCITRLTPSSFTIHVSFTKPGFI